MSYRARRLSAALFVVTLAAGLAAPALADTTVVVLVASTAEKSFDEAAAAFEKSHPGVKVQISPAGSKVIADEVAQGASADVVLVTSPVAKGMSGLAAPQPLFETRTVIVVGKGAKGKIHGPKDLLEKGVRLGSGTAGSVAAQLAADTFAQLAKHYGADFAQKAQANVVLTRTNNEGVAKMIADGTVDAAILYAGDAPAGAETIDLGSDGVGVSYTIATTGNAPHAAQARDFIAMLRSPEGQQILRAHHEEPLH